ncbi:MAG: phospho-N-acetylmuramoyl-pentapeptide-transferase [Planctomycetes bacterium]|nr:phospho-N-acetylmuramoyl-pentapeptide-transferase [Planctomycetota bacterium]MCW8134831.1 phospho-N-acetylmuramoyl-pentapeptide-transferase [Planctomycetota bacterium]
MTLAIAQSVLTVIAVMFGVFVLGAALSFAGGRLVIPWLVKRKLNDGEPRKASDYLNLLHADKKNTPTMGGAFLVPAVMLAALAGSAALALLGAPPRIWVVAGLGAFVLCAGGALGLYDDYCKLTRRGKDGISAKDKLLAQGVIAALACTGAALLLGPDGRALLLPFVRIDIGWLMVPLGMIVMVGASNAYNLTDGLDGLAGGTGAIAFYALGGAAALFAIFGETDPVTSLGVSALGMAAAGGLLGFLAWNRHPAKVFMGDTGSLALGGLLGVMAVLGRMELLLAVAGGVFVAEAGSVMLQVGYFRVTGGKRIFRCSPLHHHFQFGGWHESRVTRTFWKVGMLCALLALALLPTIIRPATDAPSPASNMAEDELPPRAASVLVQR